MSVQKLSISMPAEVAADVRAAARESGQSVSAWVVAALGDRLRHAALGRYIAYVQAEDGPFTEEELAQARRRLGYGENGEDLDAPEPHPATGAA